MCRGKCSARRCTYLPSENLRFILQGVLIDLAELETRSRGEILGILLAVATIDDPARWKSWKEKGDAKLAEVDAKGKN